jgi:hypothetical protein
MSHGSNPYSLVALHANLMIFCRKIKITQLRMHAACQAARMPDSQDVAYHDDLQQYAEDLRNRIKPELTKAQWASLVELQERLLGIYEEIDAIKAYLEGPRLTNLSPNQAGLQQRAEDLREQIKSLLTKADYPDYPPWADWW